MKGHDILFIHPPRDFQPLTNPLMSRAQHFIMPMGFFSMADMVAREGFETRIINYTLEKILNPKYSLLKDLKKHEPRVVAVDLHWINHSFGALEILKLVKKHLPETFTLLGGYSSAFFAREIIEKFPQVDAIIQGEAEKPIIELLHHINDLEQVPNLVYRDKKNGNGRIKQNNRSYVAYDLDDLNFAKVKFLKHWKEYLHHLEKTLHIAWTVEIARGCPFNCMFCGGGIKATKPFTNRNRYTLRSPERVLDDIREMVDVAGTRRVYYSHGYFNATKRHFLKLFSLLKKENIDIGADLEAYRLPIEKTFIKSFIKSHNKEESMMWFSVRNFSESTRKKMASLVGKYDDSFNYTNQDLDDFISICTKFDLPVRLFWDIGYPGESVIDFTRNIFKSVKLFGEGIAGKKNVSMWTEPIITSPGSLVFHHSEQLGIKLFSKSFIDYYNLMKQPMRFQPLDMQMDYKTPYFPTFALKILIRVLFSMNLFGLLVSDKRIGSEVY